MTRKPAATAAAAAAVTRKAAPAAKKAAPPAKQTAARAKQVGTAARSGAAASTAAATRLAPPPARSAAKKVAFGPKAPPRPPKAPPPALREPVATFGEATETIALPARPEPGVKATEPVVSAGVSSERSGRMAFPSPAGEGALVGAGTPASRGGSQVREWLAYLLAAAAAFSVTSFTLLKDPTLGIGAAVALGVGLLLLGVLLVTRR